MIYHSEIVVKTVAGRPSYHELQEDLMVKREQSKITNGLMVVTTPHTTCSLYYDEQMHDVNYFGDEFLQVDINNVMEQVVPRMTSENQYNSPGKEHIAFGLSLGEEDYPAEKWVMLNTDAHLRASIYGGHSETLIIKEQELLCGSLGKLYFVDWDQLRERKRTIHVMIMGE